MSDAYDFDLDPDVLEKMIEIARRPETADRVLEILAGTPLLRVDRVATSDRTER